jgi:hypothetical protein
MMAMSFHNATGPGRNLTFGLSPIHPTNHASTGSISHAKLEVLPTGHVSGGCGSAFAFDGPYLINDYDKQQNAVSKMQR